MAAHFPMKKCCYCGKEYPDDAVVCAVDQNLLYEPVAETSDVASFPQPAKPSTPCPICGALDGYKPVIELRGSFSLIVFLLGGLFAVIFRNAGRPRRMQCNTCGALFNIHTPSTIVSRVIFWLLVVPSLLAILILLLHLLAIFFGHK
jgi:hypothetical protein